MSYTKGEWKENVYKGGTTIWSDENAIIYLDKPKYINSDEHKANAKIISASPDLLEACEVAYGFVEMVINEHQEYCPDVIIKEQLERAINKAKGV